MQVNKVLVTKRQIEEIKQIKEKLKKETAQVYVTGDDADVIKKPASVTKD